MTPDFQPTEQLPRENSAGLGAPAPRWISRMLRQPERWVAWSIALYTAWLAVFTYPERPELWFFVLYAGLVGKWAEAVPARVQEAMAMRGAVLVAGGYALQVQMGGLPGGQFFAWFGIPCLAYAFMLLEMRFGAVMRRPGDMLESGRIDAATSLYNRAGLAAYGNEMLAECRAKGRPLSMAVFSFADLLEVRTIYGTRTARKVTSRIVQRMSVLAGERGLAARTGAAEFTVILPGLTRERAIAAIGRVLGKPCRIEFEAGDSEIVLVPGVALESSGPDIESLEELLQEQRLTLAEMAQGEQRRRNHLQRERERHSRPTGLAPAPLGAS